MLCQEQPTKIDYTVSGSISCSYTKKGRCSIFKHVGLLPYVLLSCYRTCYRTCYCRVIVRVIVRGIVRVIVDNYEWLISSN